MKKSTKFVSLLLALMLAVSTFAGIAVFPASAADGQKVNFRFPSDGTWKLSGLKINSRTGKANVYCYAYAIYGNTHKYSLGWKTRTTQCLAVDEGSGLTESKLFTFDLSTSKYGGIEEGADYGIIFSTAADGQEQTCDLTMTTDCIGDTMYIAPYYDERSGQTIATRENAADSTKLDYYAAWEINSDTCGPKATISSLGNLLPGMFPKNQPPQQQLSNALKQYLTNPVNNPYFQYENNMKLCDQLGVTPQQVYDQYMLDNADKISGDPETDPEGKIPCPFYRYMEENDQEQIVEKKLAAPDYVKEVLGLNNEEPTTEEPTTLPAEIESVTVDLPGTIAPGEAIVNSVPNTANDEYEIADLSWAPADESFAYGTDYTCTVTFDAKPGYTFTDGTTATANVTEGSITDYATNVTNYGDTLAATFTFTMPEEPTTEEPTTEEPTTEPAPADTYTVAGSSAAIFGSTWDATNTANDMTKGDDGIWTITYSDVQPESAIQLKVLKNHSWDEAWGDKETGDNYTFNVDTACDVTVSFDPATETVTVTGEGVSQDTSLDVYSVIAVGNGEDTYLNGANWDPCDPANAMTEVSDGIWEMTMEDIYAFDNYNIKFAINSIDEEGNPTTNPWAHNFGAEVEQLYPTGEPIDAVYNGKNCIFEVEEDGSTVKLQLDLREFDFKTKQGAKMTITVEAPEEEPTTEVVPSTEEPTTEAPTTEEPTTEAPTTEEPTTEAPTTEEPTTEPTPDDAVYTVAGSSAAIFGSTWDATNTANDMTKGDDGIWTITYSDVQPESAIQLKVLKNHSWDEAWGDKETGDNYTFNVDTACDVTVSFDPATETVTVTGEGVSQDTSLDVYSVIAVGNGEDTYLNGANWDPCDPANAMTEVSDGIWEMTMEDIYAFDNYNIKFAINSIDEEGNPTTNPWAHNFGAEVEQLYPTGEPIDAVYNGKNCIFEVEEDGSTVKLQLDLREFDFKTKKGAKMTITVTPPEPLPSEGLIGDVNGDGVVTVSDATLIQQYAIELPIEGPFNNKLADVNNDGVITILDASCVQRYVAEMTKKIGNAGKPYESVVPASDDPQIIK